MSGKGALGAGMAIVTIVVAIVYSYATREKKPPTPTTQTSTHTYQTAPAPRASGEPAMRTIRFDGPTDCGFVYLNDDVMFYPLGGPITIVHTKTKKEWRVDPLVDKDKQKLTGLTEGMYIVCPDLKKPGATSVDIWTRWAIPPAGI